MDFIDVQRAFFPVSTVLHPVLILKGIVQPAQHGLMVRTQLHAVSVGVAVVRTALAVINAVLVALAFPGVGQDAFIKIAVSHLLHGDFLSPSAIPDNRNPVCRRGKSAEHEALPLGVGSQPLVGVKTIPRIKAVKIHGQPSFPKNTPQNLC